MTAGSSPTEMTPLVQRAQRGDRAALEELLASVAPSVARFGRRVCGDDADADDALQDTLLAIVTHLPEFEGRSSFSTWVFTLVRTACQRRRRGLANQPKQPLDDALGAVDRAPSPESAAARAELRAAVLRALDALPDDQSEVLALRDVEGLSAKEAAEVLGVSVDALKSRLHRARLALRGALRPVLEDAAPPPSSGCPDVLAALSQKLEGDLDARACEVLEGHVATCASCHAACDALRLALDLCRHLDEPGTDAALRRAITRAVDEWAAARADST